MKATLKFNLDDPEDVMAHLRCVKALKMAIALSDILALNRMFKYEEPPKDSWETFDKVMEKIAAIVEENDLSVNELIQ